MRGLGAEDGPLGYSVMEACSFSSGRTDFLGSLCMFIIAFSKKHDAGASVYVASVFVVRKLVDLQLDDNDRRTNLVSPQLDVICAVRSLSRALFKDSTSVAGC